MKQLNRSIIERYEIPDHRPATLRAALFGANRTTLGVAARLFDPANDLGGGIAARLFDRVNDFGRGIGAVCFAPVAKELRA